VQQAPEKRMILTRRAQLGPRSSTWHLLLALPRLLGPEILVGVLLWDGFREQAAQGWARRDQTFASQSGQP
jgi:hypothetical protein